MQYILPVLLGYLLGCSNLAYYISRSLRERKENGLPRPDGLAMTEVVRAVRNEFALH